MDDMGREGIDVVSLGKTKRSRRSTPTHLFLDKVCSFKGGTVHAIAD